MKIRFSHNYPKLHEQHTAVLIDVLIFNRSELTAKFIHYDTIYDGGYYPLPPGKYMVLVFLGNELIPFTTVRPWTLKKYQHYHGSIQKTFDIIIKPEISTPESVTEFLE